MKTTKQTKISKRMKNKEYRDAYVAAHINAGVPFQIRAIRKSRGLTQKQLAEKAGMKQGYICRLENPDGGAPNLQTLTRLASAFDCALVVRFAPFSELLERTTNLGVGSLAVASFDDDAGFRETTPTHNLYRRTVLVRAIQWRGDNLDEFEEAGMLTGIEEHIGPIIRTTEGWLKPILGDWFIVSDKGKNEAAAHYTDTQFRERFELASAKGGTDV